ncbi:MAG: DUF5659 domain-containing protein [Candidatus Saccharibacteria bacterium]
MNVDQPLVHLSDLSLAAALVSVGHEMINASMSEADGMYFAFARTKKLRKSADKYWAGTLKVKARQYSDNKDNLRKRARASKFEL